MIIVIKKIGYITDILWEANLCKRSPVSRELITKVGTLEDSNESVIVHLKLLLPKNCMIPMPRGCKIL